MNRSFFPGVGEHGGVEQPQVREPLPLVARHLAESDAFPCTDLVVAERKDEALRPRVHRPERDLVVVVLPEHGSSWKYASVSCIQPMSHLRSKPSPPSLASPVTRGHAVDSSAIASASGKSVRIPGSEIAQERDRVEVLAPAEAVRDPLALLSRVVEVEHRRDRIEADAVHVVATQPPRGTRREESSAPRAARS
jgi:hypothetical protein